MNHNSSFIVGKIYNNAEFTMNLYNGVVYINPLVSFGVGKLWSEEKCMHNKYRDDLNEGMSTNIDVNNPNFANRVVTFFQDIAGIPRDVNAIGEIDSRFLYENIFCLTALHYDYDKKELLKPDEELARFEDGDKTRGMAIVIYDVQEFLRRIMEALSDSLGSPYWVAYGLVDYDFDKYSNGETDEFTKERSFSYQQEFRIAIKILEDKYKIRKKTSRITYNPDTGTLSLDVGSLRDIAFVLSVEDYINLRFPDGYQWIKTKEPKKVCTFYPPVKNELSYIYPLVRSENVILISEHGMYPAKRDLNAYMINCKRLEKTRIHNPASDSFFLSVMELYFSRMLDIYKSRGDKFLLEQLLTAIMEYMLALNVFDCAGMHLKIEGGVLKASYEDMCLHDISLVDELCFDELKMNLLKPRLSDFAVLATLSDQKYYEEYEYEGERYVRVEVARDGILPSGKIVKKGEIVWVEVSKVKFKGY